MRSGDVISYMEMCLEEGTQLQRGMNYRLLNRPYSVILMSTRPGAPYADRVEDNGKVLIYEGHDVPRTEGITDPKSLDQPLMTPNGSLTQNGRFMEAVKLYKSGNYSPEIVRVYEKLSSGIWVYNGLFQLLDGWQEADDRRKVCKFKLRLTDDVPHTAVVDLPHTRMIPSAVKVEVWKRDKGQCVICGNKENLHFDHDIPFSKGGTSLSAANIRLLCAKHNLAKSDRIE